MRATLMYGAGDVRVETIPDPVLVESDRRPGADHARLHLRQRPVPVPQRARPSPGRIGHEFIGVVEELGADVASCDKGDLVDRPVRLVRRHLRLLPGRPEHVLPHTAASGAPNGVGGGQAEAVRVPFADGTLVKLPVGEDRALLPSLLTLSDVFGTGHHAALAARVRSATTVTVIGDGAVGLSAVLAARRLGAERIILMGRHTDRTDLGREFGATDVVAERGEEGIARVREFTGGDGTHAVIEAVGYPEAFEQAVGVVRAGGAISRVGVPQYARGTGRRSASFGDNITMTGGPAPARAYIEELLPDVLAAAIDPGRVFDRTVPPGGDA